MGWELQGRVRMRMEEGSAYEMLTANIASLLQIRKEEVAALIPNDDAKLIKVHHLSQAQHNASHVIFVVIDVIFFIICTLQLVLVSLPSPYSLLTRLFKIFGDIATRLQLSSFCLFCMFPRCCALSFLQYI